MSSTASTIVTRKVVNGVVVREIDHHHVRDFLVSVLVGVVLLLSILFYVWQRNEMIRFGYEAKQLRREHDMQLEEKRRLMLKRATLLSLDRIDGIARGKLDLTTPTGDQIFLLQPSGDGTGELSKADQAPESLLRGQR
ncbi:MAG: cell division protein FtsL [Acidobacteria bacterium]|nr:cell division protein FtsL [Acidobacteriota bacterium]